MASPDNQPLADGPSGSGGSEAPRHAGAQDERVEVLQSGLSFRSGDCDGQETAVSNRFRSNIEIVEKPRQMIVLVATIVGASYLVSFFSFFFSRADSHTRYETHVRDPRVFLILQAWSRRACVSSATCGAFEASLAWKGVLAGVTAVVGNLA